MRVLAAATIMLACNIFVRLRMHTRRCGYRDEFSACSCGLPWRHVGEHELWLKDERADAIGVL